MYIQYTPSSPLDITALDVLIFQLHFLLKQRVISNIQGFILEMQVISFFEIRTTVDGVGGGYTHVAYELY